MDTVFRPSLERRRDKYHTEMRDGVFENNDGGNGTANDDDEDNLLRSCGVCCGAIGCQYMYQKEGYISDNYSCKIIIHTTYTAAVCMVQSYTYRTIKTCHLFISRRLENHYKFTPPHPPSAPFLHVQSTPGQAHSPRKNKGQLRFILLLSRLKLFDA